MEYGMTARTAVMGSAGASQAGVASAVANTSREVGGVLGVAALGALTRVDLRLGTTGQVLPGSGCSSAPARRRAMRARAGWLRVA